MTTVAPFRPVLRDASDCPRCGSDSCPGDCTVYRGALNLVSSVELAARARYRQEHGGPPDLLDGILPGTDGQAGNGVLGCLVSFAKAGKTALQGRLQNAIARGDDFLGRGTTQTRVLDLAVEDPLCYVEDNALVLLDGGHVNITFHVGPARMTDDVLHELVTTVQRERFGLVAVETLASFWTVRDENDNAEVQREVNRLRDAARRSGATWLVHAHSSKAEDVTDGRELRGASALFGALDFALFLKRDGRGETTRRRLYGRGRFGNLAPILFDFDPETKVITPLGSEAGAQDDEAARKVAAAIRPEWETTEVVAARAGMAADKSKVTAALRRMDGVSCRGRGVKGDPYRWRLGADSDS